MFTFFSPQTITAQELPAVQTPRVIQVRESKIASEQKRQMSLSTDNITAKVETADELAAASAQYMLATGALRDLPGFRTNLIARNDDGSSPSVGLPFTINYFGTNFSRLFVNNNGNLTFNAALSTFTPFGLVSTNTPIIAPFFADVDTRNALSGVVSYGVDTVNGRQAFGANYINVGYYSSHADLLNTFQVILIDRSDTGAGNFDIEFNYEQILWETGDASGGSGGFGGTPATVGYANGSSRAGTSYQQPGSMVTRALIDSNPSTALTRNSLNSNGQIGRYVFPVRGGVVNTFPHKYDFDGDNREDLGIFRPNADSLIADFYVLRSAGGTPPSYGYSWGLPGDLSVVADYDGDRRPDIAVLRPASGTWFILQSATATVRIVSSTYLIGDTPTPGDYDGDGRADIAFWRPGAPTVAAFVIQPSSGGTTRTELFGQTGDVPIVGNFDGDNTADPAVYRSGADGNQSYFYYRGSANNPARNVTYIPWGLVGDLQVAADYDGDGKLDPAVYRASTNQWLIKDTATGRIVNGIPFGAATDDFVPADYDGDNKADVAVFRNGVWYISQSSNNSIQIITYGQAGDRPLPVLNR